MKQWMKQKGILIALSVCLMFSLAGNVMGAGTLTEISAYLNNGIKITLHGKLFEPKEDDGTKLIPITYKGRTYLPLRAVAEAVGLEVGWDAKTSTASLGEKAKDIAKDEISYIRVSPEYARFSDGLYVLKSRMPEYLSRAPGKTFEYGFAGDPDYYAGMSVTVLTNYEYDKFKATFWIDEVKDDEGNYASVSESVK